MDRAYYSSSIQTFCNNSPEIILGQLTKNNDFDLTQRQRDAWVEQTELLRKSLEPHNGKVYFEFSIPRMGKRVDAVVIIDAVIFVLEFKVGAKTYEAADLEQVVDYALDMRNFHEGSHQATLIPILVATNAPSQNIVIEVVPTNRVHGPIMCNKINLGNAINEVLNNRKGESIKVNEWESSRYKPTPTIIEATLSLYNSHSVADISRSDAAAENISSTSSSIDHLIRKSREKSEKSIIIVTGVPGSGKTLVGLNVATTHMSPQDELYSVFLSGNGPLVRILQEALARDRVARGKDKGEKIKKGAARSEVKAFIQNVHHFRDEGLVAKSKAPVEHVALFDEAQRAWTKEQTIKFMREKKNQPTFDMSEPEFLISCMDRHLDWAAIICLVGGGQEINTGEAGVAEWFDAAEKSFSDWKIYISDRIVDSEYESGMLVERASQNPNVTFYPNLHLQTSMRSFRSEKVSLFVKKLLDLEAEEARSCLHSISSNYPIVLTRDLSKAKKWVCDQAQGSE